MRELREQAYRLLLNNLRRGKIPGTDREFVYVCPSPAIYHHQWLWDSCFHAIVMARFDGELAKAELRTLLTQMQEDGFLPHLTNWIGFNNRSRLAGLARRLFHFGHHRRLTQPPVVGIAVEEVHRHTGDLVFVQEVLPALKRYYLNLAATRDPDGDGLLSIVFPIESGMDHSPVYDAALGLDRPGALAYHLANLRLIVHATRLGWNVNSILASDRFSVEDVGFNSLLAAGLRATGRLCHLIADPEEEVISALANRVEDAIIARCYCPDDGLFYSLSGSRERFLPVRSVASLLPLLLERLPSESARRLVSHITDPTSFGTPFPVPSVASDEPTFAPHGHPLRVSEPGRGRLRREYAKYQLVWRGPTWVNTNWLLCKGLRRHGYHALADDVTLNTAEMIQAVGFWEFYNPISGEGLGAESFGWSTLIVDMLDAMEEGKVPSLVPAMA